MAHTNRFAVVSIVLVALFAAVGTGLLAGPVLAQETTDDGMTTEGETMDGGNESMDDGMTTDDATMTDDGMATEDSMAGEETMGGDEMTTDGMNDGETMDGDGMTTDDAMAGEEAMDDEEMTTDSEETMMDGGDETAMDDAETASGGQPGFGLLVGLLALVAAAAVALRRRSG